MMKSKYFIITLLGLLTLFNSCTDSDSELAPNLNGIYSGTFTVEYKDGKIFSNPVSVQFEGENFLSSTGTNRFPAGGNGKFEVRSSTIEFVDKNFWTADFDWNLILSGTYAYKINGSKLTLSAGKNDVGFYKYELNKD